LDTLRRVVDHAIARHDPALIGGPDGALGLLRAVAQRQARLIAQWMNVGFIHGVMNTDNMTISGETIDYGPCAFMEAFDPQAVFSSIDHGGRYAYGNQPHIARWNLARLAEALLPLMADVEDEASVKQAIAQVTEVIDTFPLWFEQALLAGQRRKLGLRRADAADDEHDRQLANDWLALLHAEKVDFTLAWRQLGEAADAWADDPPGAAPEAALRALFAGNPQAPDAWLARWRQRCADEDEAAPAPSRSAAGAARRLAMLAVNPIIIPRNHLVEEALAAATQQQDLVPFERLLMALKTPFEASTAHSRYAEPAPAAVTACYQTFCGT
jgi:uncharacterized protein YdiU (UPF0061 family)